MAHRCQTVTGSSDELHQETTGNADSAAGGDQSPPFEATAEEFAGALGEPAENHEEGYAGGQNVSGLGALAAGTSLMVLSPALGADKCTLMVNSLAHSSHADRGEVEWLLDSGSRYVCTDLVSFVRFDDNVTHRLTMLNGFSEEDVLSGVVHLSVMNKHADCYEERLLEEVSYSVNARNNLISMSYMLMTAGFNLTMGKDKTTLGLSKPSLRLEFKLVDGLYRMWTKKTTESPIVKEHLVLGVDKSSRVPAEDTMKLLHNRLNYAGMEDIKRMAKEFSFGLKVNSTQLTAYDCFPCRMALDGALAH
ncbi:hypothetical protein BBJ28_00016056 [Nothophytophthora sp. Chile5]|nr:hypothetical protein BBJ28_00016056 [Nothophytophthora sp. Chile5]